MLKNLCECCHSEPFAVILIPSPVILSEAKNLRSWLTVNSARNLVLQTPI
jgi:hypothetical protein